MIQYSNKNNNNINTINKPNQLVTADGEHLIRLNRRGGGSSDTVDYRFTVSVKSRDSMEVT